MSKSQIGVKKIFYGPALSAVAVPYVDGDDATGLSPAELKAFLAAATTKQVENVHEDNWNYEKSLASKTWYKNKLSGRKYRGSTDDPGDSIITFTMGKYNFETKAEFEGGAASANKWSAAAVFANKVMTLVALTEDDVYIVYTKADIVAGGVTTDDAIGESVQATAMEPDIQIESEAWILKSAVDAAA